MSSLALRIALAISGQYDQALDIGSAGYPIAFKPNYNFDNGVGANQAAVIYSKTRTLAASANEDLDLNGTTLLDAFGTALALTKVKGLIIVAAPGNTNDVVVGGASSNGFIAPFGSATDKIKVQPGGMLVLVTPSAAGYAVTAATADLLRIANGGGTTGVTYTIIVIGG